MLRGAVNNADRLVSGEDLLTRRGWLFGSGMDATAWDHPGLYALSPIALSDEIVEVYIGQSKNVSTRMRSHGRKGVNRLMRATITATPFDQWQKHCWLPGQDAAHPTRVFPAKGRHWLESVAIIAFRSTDSARGGLQVNLVDPATAKSVLTRAEVRRVIEVLDQVVQTCKLPFADDVEAWERIVRGILPPGRVCSWSTLQKAISGTTRPEVMLGMEPRPTRLVEYLRRNDRCGDRGELDEDNFDPRRRAMSETYQRARARAAKVSRFSPYSSEGALDLAVEAAKRAYRERAGETQ
jgi:hypothetical protein